MNYAMRETAKKAARFNGWSLVIVLVIVALGIAAKASTSSAPARHFTLAPAHETGPVPDAHPAREMP